MRIVTALFALALSAVAPSAAPLEAPKGPVVLTVTGEITQAGPDGKAVFDMAMLEKLPGRVTTTVTPWTKGETKFEGPLAKAVLEAVGAKGKTLVVTALNDYSVEIPVEDFVKWPVILATKMDGARMSVREKGPIFVIYPFDLDKSLYNEKYFSRSVWQVKSIVVK